MYTKGPWKLESRPDHAHTNRYVICSDEVHRIAIVSRNGGAGESEEGNAKLLASAPKLFEVSKALLSMMYNVGMDSATNVYMKELEDLIDYIEFTWVDPQPDAEPQLAREEYIAGFKDRPVGEWVQQCEYQQQRIAELEAENADLETRLATLEAQE